MKKQNFLMRKVAGYAASAMALVLLAACSAPLSKVDEYGKTDAPVFPDLSKASMDLREGVVLDKGVVALLRPGLSRDQLYQLGSPAFCRGLPRARVGLRAVSGRARQRSALPAQGAVR